MYRWYRKNRSTTGYKLQSLRDFFTTPEPFRTKERQSRKNFILTHYPQSQKISAGSASYTRLTAKAPEATHITAVRT